MKRNSYTPSHARYRPRVTTSMYRKPAIQEEGALMWIVISISGAVGIAWWWAL